MPLEPGEFSSPFFLSYTWTGKPSDIESYSYNELKTAMRWAKNRMYSSLCRLGTVNRITVDDANGNLIWEWQYGKGITFPDAAELAKHAGGADA